MEKHTTTNGRETQQLGEKLGNSLKGPVVLALISELGGGKTTFIQGLARGLGIKERIVSPTFVLERIYKIPQKDFALYHYDLYRIEPDDMLIDEVLENAKNNIIAIEWAEKITKYLPKDMIRVRLMTLKNDTKRRITISGR